MLSKENNWHGALGCEFTLQGLGARGGAAVSMFHVPELPRVPRLRDEATRRTASGSCSHSCYPCLLPAAHSCPHRAPVGWRMVTTNACWRHYVEGRSAGRHPGAWNRGNADEASVWQQDLEECHCQAIWERNLVMRGRYCTIPSSMMISWKF